MDRQGSANGRRDRASAGLGRAGIAMAVSALLASAGCPSAQRAQDGASAFLGRDYALLQTRSGRADEPLRVYRSPEARWRSYDQLIVDPVGIWAAQRSSVQGLQRVDRQRLADNFHGVILESLSADYRIVGEPGPGTLRLQVAISDAERPGIHLDTVSGPAAPGSRATRYAADRPSFKGRAAVEFRLLDAWTGELLAVGVDRRAGGKGIGERGEAWADVDEALQLWATRMRFDLCTWRKDPVCMQP